MKLIGYQCWFRAVTGPDEHITLVPQRSVADSLHETIQEGGDGHAGLDGSQNAGVGALWKTGEHHRSKDTSTGDLSHVLTLSVDQRYAQCSELMTSVL